MSLGRDLNDPARVLFDGGNDVGKSGLRDGREIERQHQDALGQAVANFAQARRGRELLTGKNQDLVWFHGDFLRRVRQFGNQLRHQIGRRFIAEPQQAHHILRPGYVKLAVIIPARLLLRQGRDLEMVGRPPHAADNGRLSVGGLDQQPLADRVGIGFHLLATTLAQLHLAGRAHAVDFIALGISREIEAVLRQGDAQSLQVLRRGLVAPPGSRQLGQGEVKRFLLAHSLADRIPQATQMQRAIGADAAQRGRGKRGRKA